MPSVINKYWTICWCWLVLAGNLAFGALTTSRDGENDIITFQLDAYTSDTVMVEGSRYVCFSFAGGGFTSTEGAPRLPMASVQLEIPNEAAGPTVRLLAENSIILANVNIVPNYQRRIHGTGMDEYISYDFYQDPAVYNRNEFYPPHPIEYEMVTIRDKHIMVVRIYPFQYNPLTKDLRIYTALQYRINYRPMLAKPAGSASSTFDWHKSDGAYYKITIDHPAVYKLTGKN